MIRLCVTGAALLALTSVASADEEAGESGEHHHGPWEMRVSVESPLYIHGSDASTNISKELELEPDVMISYVLEEKHLSFDFEIGEGFLLHSSEGADTPARTGTTIRPGIAYLPSRELPIFVTALLPIHLEPSPALLSLRLGAGIDAHTPIGKWFVEADVDLPLAGGTGAPDAFAEQALVLATGLLFHLPG
jgi:hypothetical protein